MTEKMKLYLRSVKAKLFQGQIIIPEESRRDKPPPSPCLTAFFASSGGSGTCAAFGTTDGTVILTNFVPSDAATIGLSGGDGSAREEGRKDLERKDGRKSLSFQFRGRPRGTGSICRVFTMTNDVRNLHHRHQRRSLLHCESGVKIGRIIRRRRQLAASGANLCVKKIVVSFGLETGLRIEILF